ncbi:MAG: PA2169 family four-helix-bundle protein, partial [Gammaproteobacteria bacterium]
MSTADTISLLNRLIVVERNGQFALRAAADEAYHAEVRGSLMQYSDFLGHAADELQHAVRELGGRATGVGTFGSVVHRTWMHLKASALGRDERVILDEVEQEEAEAETLLADAVTWDTPPPVHTLLQRQYEGAKRHHHVIRGLRDRLAA